MQVSVRSGLQIGSAPVQLLYAALRIVIHYLIGVEALACGRAVHL